MPPLVLVTPKDEKAIDYRQPPHNIAAEQALLGAILVNNEALYQIRDYLQGEHFYEPVHQRIYDAIQKFFDKGLIANPVTLKQYFDQDEALKEAGGAEYLMKLASSAVTIIHIPDYCETIYDLAQRRQLIGIGDEMVNGAYDADIDLDAKSQIEVAEQKLFHLASEGIAENNFKSIRVSVTDAINRAEYAFKNSGKVIGVPSGMTDLDRLLGGLQKSDLLILAGRPSMGKTALATTMAYNAAVYFSKNPPADAAGNKSKPFSVGFFSLEMSGEQLASRLLAAATSINSNKLRKGELSHEEFGTLARESSRLSQLPFFIDDTPALTIAALRTRARRLKRVHNLGLIVVDYLQLVRATHINSQTNRVQEVSEITQGLKAIAKELDVPVMALSQLSRQVESREDKRPQLSDLRESGSIEQDADVVMFVYRDEYYLMRKEPREDSAEYAKWQEEMSKVHGIAEVIVSKQRNGPIGNVQLAFQSDLTHFSDLAKTEYLPERRD